MLAKLLRRMIFIQVLLGAALGFGLLYLSVIPPWAALAIAIGFPFAVMILVDTYSALMSRGQEPFVMWLRSLLGEYAAGIRIFLFRQPWTTQAPTVLPAHPGEQRIPVVLVHGYMCNHRIWDDVTPKLRAKGHAVYALNKEPLFTSIDNYAPLIDNAVQELLAHTGAKQVALVGHSMGGLAIRAWMRKHGTERAAIALTLGTPHVGTQIPQHMPTKNGAQMAWGSDWLKALAESETEATRNLFRIALTPQDNIVYPQRAQVLPGVEPVIFNGIGHVQMCLDGAVIKWVSQQLAAVKVSAHV